MKQFLYRVLLFGLGVFFGFAFGHSTASKSSPQELRAVAVDCYDSSGHPIQSSFDQFGGVTLACAPGQTAKLHQSTH